jgi:IS5 family transposase
LDLIREKPATTQGAAIALNVLVLNLDKLLELLFVLLACWLQIVFARIAACTFHVAVLNKQPASV